MTTAFSRHGRAFTLLCLLGSALAGDLRAQDARDFGGPDRLDFNRVIRPLLSDRCFSCHGPDEKARRARLRLDRTEDATAERPAGHAVVPGDPAGSLVIERLRDADVRRRMPPASSGRTMTAAEIALVERWIREGAEFAPPWFLIPPRDGGPPKVANERWPRDPLDRFVLARIESNTLSPSQPAGPPKLLRRASLVLTGLPPSAELRDAFLANPDDAAFERAVDALLASPRFGEHLAAPWLDLARYSDSFGYQSDVDRLVWPWRDWVVRSFNENLPYDQFVLWQLAGDLLPDATEDQRLATAFNRLHRQTNEGGSVEEEFRASYVADRTNTFGQAFLGLTIECARCHDHKFDPITQADYYALSAFFANIDESGLYSHFTNATPTPALPLASASDASELAAADRAITEAEGSLTSALRAADAAFPAGLAALDATTPFAIFGLVGDFPFDDRDTDGKLKNLADEKQPGRAVDAPQRIAGGAGGYELTGEDALTFPGTGVFAATQPFAISLGIKTPGLLERAVVLHRSRAWTDAGSQGYELLIEDGRLTFALIHFWPGDAAAIRTNAPLPIGRFVRVTVVSDGSASARGLTIFVDGDEAATTMLADRLRGRITGGGDLVLTIGQRFRDKGFKGGAVDRLRVFDRALTPLEIRELGVPGSVGKAIERVQAGGGASSEEVLRWWRESLANEVGAARALLAAAREARQKIRDRIPLIMTMEELAAPRKTFVLERGAYDRKGAEVAPAFPASLALPRSSPPSNRLDLARWLLDPRHPLTARVAVNRIWSQVFGRGLVPTLENFGSQGTPPEDPLLLDHLARSFVKDGWNVKSFYRRLVLSATFRQASLERAELQSLDPEDLLLARFVPRRLSAEALRDQALAASGLLVERQGGPPVKPYQPAGLWEEKSGKRYEQGHGEALWRRSLYTFWRSTSPPPSMTIFDAPARDVCTARRHTTATPLQALAFLGDPQFVEASRVLGAVAAKSPADDAERIRDVFVRLAARPPDPKEAAILLALLADLRRIFAADLEAAKKLVTTGEAPVDSGVDPVEGAAFATLATTILASDAAVILR